MILAFDTYYSSNKAKTVCISFENWGDRDPKNIYSELIEGVAAYEPGLFYKRELPCILSLYDKIPKGSIDIIIIDGYVYLDDEGKLGLGGHLFNALDRKIPVIGVAKSLFYSNKKFVKELIRGSSKKPIFVSAIGMELDLACERIKSMKGDSRIPSLLRILDRKTKEL